MMNQYVVRSAVSGNEMTIRAEEKTVIMSRSATIGKLL